MEWRKLKSRGRIKEWLSFGVPALQIPLEAKTHWRPDVENNPARWEKNPSFSAAARKRWMDEEPDKQAAIEALDEWAYLLTPVAREDALMWLGQPLADYFQRKEAREAMRRSQPAFVRKAIVWLQENGYEVTPKQ